MYDPVGFVNGKMAERATAAAGDVVMVSHNSLADQRRNETAHPNAAALGGEDVRAHQALSVVNSFCAFAERAASEIARLRAVTGPDCPKCRHFLKAEHMEESRGWWCRCGCKIERSELLSDHPEIAKEMGLCATEVNRG